MVWLPGFHCTNRRPNFDPDLFIFHIKHIDFYEALHRQKINRETEWAAASLDQNFGGHHRWETERFVREGFFETIDMMNRGLIAGFDFTADIADFCSKVVEKDGFHYIPMGNPSKLVEIPDRLRSAF